MGRVKQCPCLQSTSAGFDLHFTISSVYAEISMSWLHSIHVEIQLSYLLVQTILLRNLHIQCLNRILWRKTNKTFYEKLTYQLHSIQLYHQLNDLSLFLI